MTRMIGRREATLSSLIGVLMLAGCSDQPVMRTSFPALSYTYLPALRLSVASVEIQNLAPITANDFSPQSPVLPTDALAQMATDRLVASGSSGRAVFVIDQASLVRTPTGLLGNFAVHIDIQSADHQHVAYASAKVTRTYTGDIDDLRGTLYDMTKQMMDDMNVELEVQVRRTLYDWVQNVSTAPPPAAVQSESLTPGPDTSSAVSPGPDTTPAPAPTPIPLQSPGVP